MTEYGKLLKSTVFCVCVMLFVRNEGICYKKTTKFVYICIADFSSMVYNLFLPYLT